MLSRRFFLAAKQIKAYIQSRDSKGSGTRCYASCFLKFEGCFVVRQSYAGLSTFAIRKSRLVTDFRSSVANNWTNVGGTVESVSSSQGNSRLVGYTEVIHKQVSWERDDISGNIGKLKVTRFATLVLAAARRSEESIIPN
jgi:hypothetical protein